MSIRKDSWSPNEKYPPLPEVSVEEAEEIMEKLYALEEANRHLTITAFEFGAMRVALTMLKFHWDRGTLNPGKGESFDDYAKLVCDELRKIARDVEFTKVGEKEWVGRLKPEDDDICNRN